MGKYKLEKANFGRGISEKHNMIMYVYLETMLTEDGTMKHVTANGLGKWKTFEET